MRRNRRKLHQELRLHAESQKALHHERRRVRLAARERSRSVFSRSGVRTPASDEATTRVLMVVESLLGLARVAPAMQKRVLRLAGVVHTALPALFAVEQLPWWLLLAKPHWVREPEAFVAPRGSLRRKRDAFAEHLLVDFPAPVFLLRSLDVEPLAVARVPVEDEWAVGILSHLGRGHSLRDLVGQPLLPAPLTRRMCHLFADAPAATSPILALRRAQVQAMGGPTTLATALMHTRLSRVHGPEPAVGEPFWHDVIGWLARRPALHGGTAEALDGLLGWIEARNREALLHGTTFRLQQRPDAAVLRDAEVWRLSRRPPELDALPASGLLPLARDGFTLTELLCRSDLLDEGREQSHCVGLYTRLVAARKVAVWSLRHEGRRVATVEVALGAGRVVQAKRAANRPCGPEELAFVRAWAAVNHLRTTL